jgi:propionate CoA-transferase
MAVRRCFEALQIMKVVSAETAVRLLHDADTLVIGGSGGGHSVPEALIVALEQRYLSEKAPRDLRLFHPVGLGDEVSQGVGRLAHRGLLKRVVTGTLVDSPPLEVLAHEDAIEAYTLPQGALSQLMREMASGRPGLLTHTGLHTFADPRQGGGKQSLSAREDLVEVVTLAGKEWLFFKPFPIDVCFLRGTTADEDGNITMEQEAVFGEMLSMAQATRRSGGVVIVQVRRIGARRTLPPKQVKIPGILVDLVVVDPEQRQSYLTAYSPAFAGELRVPLSELEPLPLDPRKVIARRAALELYPGAVCNLGSGISTGIARVAAEENVLDDIVLTNEQGLIGGAPAMGVEAGAATNYMAMVDQPYQFDFYDGGGLDLAFLSFAEVDADGNVNVSRFSKRIIGFGGFINISQNAKKVIFSGTFTAGGLRMEWPDGASRILSEGRHAKLVQAVQQISYNARYGRERGQEVLYVTERAVFRPCEDGLEITEIAPGIDIDRDIVAHMGFRPKVAADLKPMDARLFLPGPMGLAADIQARAAPLRARRLSELDL